MLNNPNEWHNIEEDLENKGNEEVAAVNDAKSTGFSNNNMSKIKIGLVIVGVVLIALIAVAKKMGSSNTELASTDPTASPMSTPMYDESSSGNEPMAVVDVNLNDAPAGVVKTAAKNIPVNGALPIAAAPMPAARSGTGDIVIASKEITPTDKYDFNKQAIQNGASKGNVIVSIGGEGRPNPFFPFKEKKGSGIKYPGSGNVSFDIIEPPSSLMPDPQAATMMETTISGIMYDTRNPSAIVNVNGTDQLVRRNDKVHGYTILDITKDKVVIKSGTNIYRASVGQSISNEEVSFNEISNLKQKFGGSYSPIAKNYINFNAN